MQDGRITRGFTQCGIHDVGGDVDARDGDGLRGAGGLGRGVSQGVDLLGVAGEGLGSGWNKNRFSGLNMAQIYRPN